MVPVSDSKTCLSVLSDKGLSDVFAVSKGTRYQWGVGVTIIFNNFDMPETDFPYFEMEGKKVSHAPGTFFRIYCRMFFPKASEREIAEAF